MYYVYILRGIRTGILYKGFTNNLERRLLEHSQGKVQTTRKLIPFQLVHVEQCDTRKAARELEIFFKSGWGREILDNILI